MAEHNPELPWYRRYFGADYLRIYRLQDTPEQLTFLRRALAPVPAGARLLDLPCGHGRHAVELAGWGYRVTGLDLSPVFLGVAAEAAAARGVRPRLVRGDMRTFPFANAAFDAAVCMFTSLGYFDTDAEHQRVLDEFGRVCRPGARFVLDLANVEAVRQQPSHAQWRKGDALVSSEYLWDEPTHRAVTRRHVRFDDGHEARYESSVRLFEAGEIGAMLHAAGWRVEEQAGSYLGGPVGPQHPRRILICRREA